MKYGKEKFMSIGTDIRYIGVNDHVTDLFESQYPIKTGVTYNSYVILDEKIAVFDTVGTEFAEEWYKNMDAVLEGKKPDYLHRHAYMTKTTDRIIHDLALKYGIIDSQDVMDSELIKMPRKMDWMRFGSADAQLENNLEAFILEDKGGLLGADTAMLVAHCGFADVRITQLSSYNLLRLTDLEAMISERTAQWIRDNNIELITYKDLDERFMPQ